MTTTPREGTTPEAEKAPTQAPAPDAAEASTDGATPEAQGDAATSSATSTHGLRLWSGSPARADKALLWTLGGIALFYLAMWPLRPFMIQSAPVALALVNGSKAAIGTVAAFAEAGRYPVWLALVAGVVGMAKFDWLFWWAGRRWGEAAVEMFAQTDRARRTVRRARDRHPWVLRLLVVCGRVPGVPGGVFYSAAGWSGMSLAAFLTLDLLGVLLVAGAIVLLGYSLGEQVVDLVVLVDTYAVWVSVAIVVGLACLPTLRRRWRARRAGDAAGGAGAGDAEEPGTEHVSGRSEA